jgi:hypothetical protein
MIDMIGLPAGALPRFLVPRLAPQVCLHRPTAEVGGGDHGRGGRGMAERGLAQELPRRWWRASLLWPVIAAW